MAGTKMRLHRYGGLNDNFYDQLEIITEEWLASHPGYFISTAEPYDMEGGESIDIHYNGQKLTEGGGYEKIDPYTIRIDLGTDEEGNPILLLPRDEIEIRVWKNRHQTIESISHDRFAALQEEVKGILSYSMGGNIHIDYTYDGNYIVREDVTGDYELTREIFYNEINEVEKEVINYKGKTITRLYTYDFSTKKLLSSSVSVTS